MLNSLIDPVREATYACDAENQGHCAKTLKPRCICQCKVMFILNRTKKEFSDNTENVDCSDHD